MGIPLGPHPENKKAIEEFNRICDEKKCPQIKGWLYRIFGKKKIQQHEQWQTFFYEWRGQKMLFNMKFIGYSHNNHN